MSTATTSSGTPPVEPPPTHRPPPTGFRQLTSGLRVLPDFVIVGAQRCGTTSLYRYLAQHPLMVRPSRKEVHFFDKDESFAEGEAHYRGHFPTRARMAVAGLLHGGTAITGESTPAYLYRRVVAARLAGMLPQARMIALLRDPVERAWSNYKKRVIDGDVTRPFEEEIADWLAEVERHQRAGAGGELRVELQNGPGDAIGRGLYHDQLRRLHEHYPRAQVLVVQAENLFSEPANAYRQITDFLGLPPFAPSFKMFNATPTGRSMTAGTRARLTAFYAPHNERLYEYLGRDLGWQR